MFYNRYMKIGIRKPNLKKRLRASTTAKYVRMAKRSLPTYNQKGMGIFHNLRKAIYNRIYNRTTRRLEVSIPKVKTYDENKTMLSAGLIVMIITYSILAFVFFVFMYFLFVIAF